MSESAVNFPPLPGDWERERLQMQRLATHVLAAARFRHDAMFDLVPSPGGFGTPAVGPDRERVRLVGGSMFVERVTGARLRDSTASTEVVTVSGNTIRGLCGAIGFEPGVDFDAGPDTPPMGDVDELLVLDAAGPALLGDWYLLGQRAVEEAVASLPEADASVGRLWPEHFDFGIDLAARPGVRCNLGAAAGDASDPFPYLYLGPWGAQRPGPAEYWTAPFGATLTFAELQIANDPLGRAIEFYFDGLAYLRRS